MFKTPEPTIRELDSRTSDGFDVKLLWNSAANRIFVTVNDQRHGGVFTLEVDAATALEAFHHPFAYSRQLHAQPSQPRDVAVERD